MAIGASCLRPGILSELIDISNCEVGACMYEMMT